MESDTRTILGMSMALFVGLGLAVLLLAGLVVGGWRAGWWFTVQNNNREAHMIQNGYSNQSGLLARIDQDMAAIETDGTQIAQASGSTSEVNALKLQRSNTASDLCQAADAITTVTLPANQKSWVAANCTNGVLKTGSPDYYVSNG